MKSTPGPRNRFAASLFEGRRSPETDVLARVREFACVVARRHRGERDRARMIVALRGYYRTWAICAPNTLPALDAAAIAAAVAAYDEACGAARRRPAA